MDLVELIDFGVAGEERLAVAEFAHDAPDGPGVDLLSVVGAEQQLGGAVPARGDVVCHVDLLVLVGKCAGEPEVAELQGVRFGVDEQVFGFDVAVDDAVPVAVLDGLDELVDVDAHVFGLGRAVSARSDLTEMPFVFSSRISSRFFSQNSKTR